MKMINISKQKHEINYFKICLASSKLSSVQTSKMNAVCVSMVDKVGAQLKFLRELTLQLLHFFFPSLLVRERECLMNIIVVQSSMTLVCVLRKRQQQNKMNCQFLYHSLVHNGHVQKRSSILKNCLQLHFWKEIP